MSWQNTWLKKTKVVFFNFIFKFLHFIFQVHHDLRQLQCSIEKASVSDRATTLDIQALNDGICRVHSSIRVRKLHTDKNIYIYPTLNQLDANSLLKPFACTQKHAEDFLKTVNRQQLVLPSIEDLKTQTLKTPKW